VDAVGGTHQPLFSRNIIVKSVSVSVFRVSKRKTEREREREASAGKEMKNIDDIWILHRFSNLVM